MPFFYVLIIFFWYHSIYLGFILELTSDEVDSVELFF